MYTLFYLGAKSDGIAVLLFSCTGCIGHTTWRCKASTLFFPSGWLASSSSR